MHSGDLALLLTDRPRFLRRPPLDITTIDLGLRTHLRKVSAVIPSRDEPAFIAAHSLS
ncbi:hypothetical protein IU486_19820 [Streptomyces gardneri]|nr:hypothetical protein [Streptomyces gardneri]MBF6475327.1 hypothetical protein [Nocardia abscessus]